MPSLARNNTFGHGALLRSSYLRRRHRCERLFVVLTAPLTLPLCTLVATAIKIDSRGPVLFRQRRPGRGDSYFEILKFRTMYHSAAAQTTVTFPKDQRITRVGRFLRRTHIDELPQLWNIVRGEMSFIGPRPEPIPNDARYRAAIPNFSLRRNILPGLTGLAQTELGYTVDVTGAAQKLQLDLHYIEHASPALDARIIFQTMREMILPRRSW